MVVVVAVAVVVVFVAGGVVEAVVEIRVIGIVDDTNNGGVGRINGGARVGLRGGVPGCCGGGVPYMWVVYVVVKKGADVDT